MKGLSFFGRHGLLPGEKDKPQLFKLDLVLFHDLKTAGRQDDIAATVDYGKVFHEVRQIVEETSYNLIEALAEEVSCRVLLGFPLLSAIETTVYKPQAPIEGEFDYVAVQIYRCREDVVSTSRGDHNG
jgi:dihydroneopterin aldolase